MTFYSIPAKQKSLTNGAKDASRQALPQGYAPQNFLFSENSQVILLEFLNTLIRQRMLGHLLQHLVGNGGDIRTGQGALGDMNAVAHGGGNDLAVNIIILGEDIGDVFDQLEAGRGNGET